MICKIFGHKFLPSKFKDWLKDRTNFICRRCDKRVKTSKETLYKNRNKTELRLILIIGGLK